MKNKVFFFDRCRIGQTFKLLLPLVVWIGLSNLNAQPLRQIAASKGKFIGNIMSNNFLNNYQVESGNHDAIAKTEYNIFVTENAMKMDALLPNQPANPFNVTISDINTINIDRFVNYARSHNMRTRGHVMIWFSQAPAWLTNAAPGWTSQQVYDFSRTYITALATYCAGKIDEWDVLNEAITDGTPGYRPAWYSVVNSQPNNDGQIGYFNYIKSLFIWARNADPAAKLFYNDYSIEPFGENKNNFMRTLVKDLKSAGAPIDGVGFQSHFDLDGMNSDFFNSVGQSIDDLGTAGLEVALTELDIRRCNGFGSDAIQRSAYQSIVSTALSRSNCKSVLIWGISDGNSWIPAFSNYQCGDATLHNTSFQKKQAYFGVQDALNGLSNGGGGGTNYVVRARGTQGGEQIELRVNDQVKTTWTLNTSMTEYVYAANAGTVRVQFINDSGARDVVVDYLKVNGNTLQAEDQAVNTGVWAGSCGGGSYSEWLNCNGYIEFPGSTNRSITVRAQGIGGGERIELRVNNVVKTSWILNTSMTNYTYSTPDPGAIRVQFTNDGPGKDVRVDYVQVNSSVFQSEDQSVNTAKWDGFCGGGAFSEIMHCDGYIEYAGSQNALREPDIQTRSVLQKDLLTIYPNPAIANVSLVFESTSPEPAQVRVWRIDGTLLRTFSIEARSAMQIDADLPTGFYVVETRSGGEIRTQKLVIQ
jgi:GH35 family endo-1,4-beta-xylanase